MLGLSLNAQNVCAVAKGGLIHYLLTAGAQFFSLVKSLAKRYGENKKLHFLWVDPDPFPTVSEIPVLSVSLPPRRRDS